MSDEHVHFFRTGTHILSGVGDEHIRVLGSSAEAQQYGRGDTILVKGEVPTSVFFVRRGRVAVHLKQRDGTAFTRQLSPGDVFGEMSFMEERSAMAAVKALEDGTEVLAVPHEPMRSTMAGAPEVRARLLKTIAVRRADSAR